MSGGVPSGRAGNRGLPLSWILVAALVIRLLLAISMQGRYYFGDTAEYDRLATSLIAGQGPLPDLPRQPLYPMFMVLAYRLAGLHNFQMVRLLQLGFGILIVWLSYGLARRIGGEGAGRLAALAAALAPTLVFTTALLYPTALYTLILLAMTAAAWDLAERPGFARSALLGVAFGLAWLTEQVAVAPIAALALWTVAAARRRTAGAAGVGFALLTAAAVAAPWALYAQHRSGSPTVFASKAAYVLHVARSDPELSSGRAIRDTSVFDVRRSSTRWLVAQELELVRARPLDYAHDWAAEFLHFFQPLPDRVKTRNVYTQWSVRLLGAVSFLPVLALAVLAMTFRAIPARARLLLAIVPLATAAFYAFFFAQTRYRIPVEPHLLVAAALGLQRLFPRTIQIVGGSTAAPAAASHPGP